MLQDIWLIEKMAHFDWEVGPGTAHARKGLGRLRHVHRDDDIARFTRAKLFSTIGKTTPMFVRFSTVAGERGAADAERDIRGYKATPRTGNHRVDNDHWEQPGNLFRLMTPERQQLLFEVTARAISGAARHIQARHIENCGRAGSAYGAGVAKVLAQLG